MSKLKAIGCLILSAAACPAWAQSSVTLYGIIDSGITYVNNSGGKHQWLAQSGVAQGSRWGVKGSEDLGGGTRAIFQIESGFDVESGRLAQGGLGFGRQAYVGLTNPAWGTLTLGRQYDPIVDMVQQTTMNGLWGAMFAHPSDIDNTNNAFRVNNVAKYVSPTFAGVTGEAFYAFGNTAGQFRNNSTVAGALSYSAGPLYLAGAYFYARDPATQFADGNFITNVGTATAPLAPTPGSSNGRGAFGLVGAPRNMQVIAAGGTYSIGAAKLGLDYTNTRFNDASGVVGNTARFNNYEAWGQYSFTPSVIVATGYTFTHAHIDVNDLAPRYHQVNLMVDYLLSKRTDIYAMGVYQHSAGGVNADIYQGLTGNESSTPVQVAAHIGLRHKF